MAARTLRISHVGLRGVVGAGLTAAHVVDFASAFGSFVEPGGPVVIGRDPRASGIMLRQGVIAGLMACAHDVIDLGIVSTPVIQHAIVRHQAAGGISIGASHNEAGWNALKFFGPGGSYLTTAQAGELLDLYHLRRFCFVSFDRIGKLRFEDNAIDRYLDELAAVYDLDALRRFNIVADCCNGTSALTLRRLTDRFGLRLTLLNEPLEGVHFAHEPSTTAHTVALQLAPMMRPLGADAGFLFDADSDRVAAATHHGEALSEELILPLLADYVLPRGGGRLVITNLSTSSLVEEIAARHGGRVLRVPVGRHAAMDALAQRRPEDVALAGEGTGAVMMPRFRFVYDGIASMLGILSLMHERGAGLAEILAGYPRFSMRKGAAPLASSKVPALLVSLKNTYDDGRADTTDGLRVDWPDRWFHVRVSQTEPIVRVICERRGDPPDALFQSLMEKVRVT